MNIPILSDILGKVLGTARDIVDEVTTTQEEKDAAAIRMKELENVIQLAEVQLAIAQLQAEKELVQKKGEIVLAEAKGDTWLQKNWRPLLMMAFAGILVNNFILLPYIPGIQPLAFPEGFWYLLTTGVGGYITLRSYDKKQRTDAISGDTSDGIVTQTMDFVKEKVKGKLSTQHEGPRRIPPRPLNFDSGE